MKLELTSDQISQLQKGISRSAIQIGLLNEEMRVALEALIAVNKEFDNEELEEHVRSETDTAGGSFSIKSIIIIHSQHNIRWNS